MSLNHGDNLNDMMGTIETSQKCCRPTPILLTTKIRKTCKVFQKFLENKTKSSTATVKPEVTTTTKNNDRGINNHNKTTHKRN